MSNNHTMPERMRALKLASLGHTEIFTDVAVPKPDSGYLLIKTTHVALNPSDWKHIDYSALNKPGYTFGFDAAGAVVQVGANDRHGWKVGDRVAGPSWSARQGQPDSGAFSEYCLIKGHLALRIPETYSNAQAATLGVGSMASLRALYESLKLPLPAPDSSARSSGDHADNADTILIYGGSSATGLLAIQFAKLSGMKVLATSSSRNFDKLKQAGADEVFDYTDATSCAASIHAAAGGNLRYAFDTVTEGNSAAICAGALTKEKGVARYISSQPVEEFPRADDDVLRDMLMVFPCWGEELRHGDLVFPAQPDQAQAADRFFRIVEKLLESGKIRTFESLRSGSLEGVRDGLNELKQGKVSGQKLVYEI